MSSTFAFNGAGELLLLQSAPATQEQRAWLYSVTDVSHTAGGGYVITSTLPCPVNGVPSNYALGKYETNIRTVDHTVTADRASYIAHRNYSGTHRIHKTDGSHVNAIGVMICEDVYEFEDVDSKLQTSLPMNRVTHLQWFPLP